MSLYEFQIESSGVINEVSYRAQGTGYADPDNGRIDFEATFDPVPKGSGAFGTLLSILIVPTVGFGRENDGSMNLLTVANSAFDFTQDVSGEGVAVQARGDFRSKRDSPGWLWRSEAVGSVALDEIDSVEPFQAVMVSTAPGHMVDCLTMPLTTLRGRLSINIVRHFTFAEKAAPPRLQVRHMLLRPEVSGATAGVRLHSDIVPFDRPARRESADPDTVCSTPLVNASA